MLKKRVKEWEVKHTLREANQQEDTLAKSGIGREEDLINVWDNVTRVSAANAEDPSYRAFSHMD